MKWSGIRPLTDAEAEKVFQDPRLKKRIITEEPSGLQRQKPRNGRTQCHHGQVPRRADWMQRPWPQTAEQRLTYTRQTCRIRSVVYICCRSKQTLQQWWPKVVFVAGRRCAGLSTGPSRQHRASGPIYTAPPNDPLIVEAGAYPARLYEVTGNCYGLANAPRVWYNKVRDTLLEAGFEQHSLDKCFFYHHVTTVTVSWMRSSSSTLTTWCAPILRPSHSTSWRASLNVAASPKLMNNIQANTGVRRFNSPSRMASSSIQGYPEEVSGQSWWRQNQAWASSTRTQIDCGWVERDAKCLRMSSTDCGPSKARCGIHGVTLTPWTRHRHPRSYKNSTTFAKATADSGLVFPAIPFGRSSAIVTFADSGWANAAKFASQFEVMVTLCPAQVTEKTTYGFALDWKSGRSPRICRSTLAAEACAADEGTDRSCYVNMFLTELLFQSFPYSNTPRRYEAYCTSCDWRQVTLWLFGCRKPNTDWEESHNEYSSGTTSPSTFSDSLGSNRPYDCRCTDQTWCETAE